MDIYDLIAKRRSIRQYKSKEIPKEILERIINAALWAPSGKNLQNWRFYLLRGEEKDKCLALTQKAWLHLKDNLEKRLKPSLYKFTERFFFTLGGAPVIIFAYNKPDPNEHNQTMMGGVYMAVQNLVLAAQSEGLGTCTMGAFLEIKDDVNKLINPPEDLQLVCGVVVGYPDHEPPAPPRQPGKITWLGF